MMFLQKLVEISKLWGAQFISLSTISGRLRTSSGLALAIEYIIFWTFWRPQILIIVKEGILELRNRPDKF